MNTPHEKTCTQCHALKPLTEFYNEPKSSDGKAWYCKVCMKGNNAARAAKPKIVVEVKICKTCATQKPIDQFGIDSITKDGHATRCLLCKRAESESYRSKEPGKVRAANARWKAENPDKVTAYEKTHVAEKSRRNKARYEENKAFINAQNTARHAAREWERHNHTTEVIAGVNDLSTEQILEIRVAYASICQYCDKLLEEGQCSIDHVFPLSRGGPNTLSNVVLSCRLCNAKKKRGDPPRPVHPLLITTALPKTPTRKDS